MSRLAGVPYDGTVKLLAVSVLSVVLVAGLWPFHAPANAVSWLKGSKGLSLGRYGTAVSRGPFQMTSTAGLSLEMWLKPARTTQQSAILTFDSSPVPRSDFSIRQFGSSVAISRYMVNDQNIPRRPWVKVDDVFHQGQTVLLTIVAGQGMTKIYENGAFKDESSTLGMVPGDLTGRLVLANSAVNESWAGEVMGLAIYDRELTANEVHRHFDGGNDQWGSSVEADSPVALYLFDEGQGNAARNKLDQHTDLIIPAHYFVLHPDFLRSFWDELNSGAALRRWSYWEDVTINIVGFIPVGIVFTAYLATVQNVRNAKLLVVISGFCLSLMIEVLQRFLPTRNSGMTDLVTNTMGTVIGIVLFRLVSFQRLLGGNRLKVPRDWATEVPHASYR